MSNFYPGFNRSDQTVVAILSTVHVHIVPQFNVYGSSVAMPGDCTGEKYSGPDSNELVRKKVKVFWFFFFFQTCEFLF